jgi:hypothetical protein
VNGQKSQLEESISPFLYSEGGEELLWNERKSEKKLSWVDFEPAFDFEVGRRTL